MFTSLSFASSLFVSEVTGPGLCQFCMNLAKGIVIGAVNGLQLNKWYSQRMINRSEWQLITIFGKDR